MLAMKLRHLRKEKPIVYALPRGGVIVAAPVAQALNAPLDLIIVRKIGHPANPEYAVCAVTESGELLCNEEERKQFDAAWFREETKRGREEAARRRSTYLERASLPPTGRTAIIVDDGVATGLSVSLAVREVRKGNPRSIVVAVPVAPADIAQVLALEADECVILEVAKPFLGAIGSYYDDFGQVSDAEVIAALRAAPHSEASEKTL